ncbi:glutathione S-transferase [Sphingomicrobium aestuariivivum]|uniref:glutathione S-transferase n=1 Tax=Sphingomicrobium aestuariivivum TaxID=1582356 RepID=UPI001FD6401A|nr:glutathione S-transferase [Sphingomicrobium aestuariivivum]MCJ8190009.1 glutathione S-transferase [Sphingomicrobium aestuariivivum]
MIIVHHLENSRSQRILWLLEELGLEYEVKRYERHPKTMRAPDSLKAIHPLGKSPLIEEGEVVLAETGAIMEHLVAERGRYGAPESPVLARHYHFYMHYAEGSLMPPLFGMLIVNRLGLLGKPAKKPVMGMLAEHFAFLDKELEQRDWFAGADLTAADMMMSFPLEAAQARAGLDERYPNILRWLKQCHERPAYQRALARGGEYAYAG